MGETWGKQVKLDEILGLWRVDTKIDRGKLDEESLKIPELHHKYYKIFCQERMLLKKKQLDYKKLYRQKMEYYEGRLDKDELDENEWEQFDIKVLKKDVPIYIEGDTDIVNHLLGMQYQEEKVDLLKSILNTINARSFHIKDAIEFLKFTQGNF